MGIFSFVFMRKIMPKFFFNSTNKTFHYASFNFVVGCGKKMNIVVFEPALKCFIGKFCTQIGLQGGKMTALFQYFRKCSYHTLRSFILYTFHISVFRKHIDHNKNKFKTVIVFLQTTKIDQVCLKLLFRTSHNDFSSWKLLSNRFVKSVSILGQKPLFYFRILHGSLKRRRATKRSRFFIILII